MKPLLFVFGLIISAQISVIKGNDCHFKYSNGTTKTTKYFKNNCECGLGKTQFHSDNDTYCCVPSNSTCVESKKLQNDKIDVIDIIHSYMTSESKTNKWCEDGQLLPFYQPCNGSCLFDGWYKHGIQEKCPQINGASFTNEQCYSKGWSDDDKYSVILI